MRLAMICMAAAVLVGCANAPRSRDPSVLLADTTSTDIVRFEGEVAIPFDTAFRNLLREARQCWSRASLTGFLGANWTVDHDVDSSKKEGSIYVSDRGAGKGIVFVSLDVKGQGDRTRIKAAAVNPRGGTLPGAPEIPLLPKWANGEKTTCATPDFLL
jgi:hypothetical protein